MQLDKKTYSGQTQPMQSQINVGCGNDVTINELSYDVAKVTGYTGMINLDPAKPDALLKLMNSGRMHRLGWSSMISLDQGLSLTYADMLLNNE